MMKSYFEKMNELFRTVEKKESKPMKNSAEIIATAIQNDRIIHLFGCGHSHILAEEMYYRAGGLVPIHPIFHEPLMLHEGAVRSSSLERKNDYAPCFMEQQDIRSGDVIIVVSTSGRNPVPVDVALIAKQKGAFAICLTSVYYAQSQPSRHQSGNYLHDVVDIVIDNHAPVGDALLRHDQVKAPFSPSSTVIGAAIMNAVFAEAITLMVENSFEPPILLSGNVEGADEHNQKLIEKYRERISL